MLPHILLLICIKGESDMRGIILEFNQDNGKGLISGSDEKRYHFTKEDWKSDDKPETKMEVDFDNNDKAAHSVYCVSNDANKETEAFFSGNPTGLIGGAIIVGLLWWFGRL